VSSKKEKYSSRTKPIGKKLRKIRIEKGYSNYDFFAWENNLSPKQYLNMEQGKNFTINSLIRILEIHEMTLEEFFKGIK